MVEKLKTVALEILSKVRKQAPPAARRTLILWPLIIITLVSVYALPDSGSGGEFFPLTSYPMYSRNGSWTYLVYITDQDGLPLAAETELGQRTSVLKDIYKAEMDKLAKKFGLKSKLYLTPEQREPAGLAVLRHLAFEKEASTIMVRETGATAIEAVEVRIRVANDKTITITEDKVARLELTEL
ncbi:MAG: hypothetical protein ACI8UO_000055 [Verrucomicrobiales bacterium]|jgi:hypothetical protein